jgi:hypothetical protein
MSEWDSLLLWNLSFNSSGYAIMDGELQITDGAPLFESIMDTIDSDTRRVFEEMLKFRSSLGTWEITSSDDVLRAVRNLGEFSWTHCPELSCSKLPKHQAQLKDIRSIYMGPDARNPPWNLNVWSFRPPNW